ncbi:MAG: hypothetical protein KDH20_12980 [Rhodocyclaceae bacterium]|nr:hypothetical protein [Rhodocyclaceae bacterium]
MPADETRPTGAPLPLRHEGNEALPSDELLEWLGELEGGDEGLDELDILASETPPLMGLENRDGH